MQPVRFLRCPFKFTSTSHKYSPIAFLRLSSQPPKKADTAPTLSLSGDQWSITGADGGRLNLACGGAGPLVLPGRDLVVVGALLKTLF